MQVTKRIFLLSLVFGFCFIGCTKSTDANNTTSGGSSGSSGTGTGSNVPVFINYIIKKGQQYSDQNVFALVNYTEQKFIVKFDSSVIYTTVDPNNQFDINKLYGFSDSDSLHHVYSARFGWNWQNGHIWLYAYVYNNTVLLKQTLTTVPIGQEVYCSIKVAGSNYVFTVNGNATTVPRLAKTTTGVGYKLYPFFGGTENAPHDIKIAIKEY